MLAKQTSRQGSLHGRWLSCSDHRSLRIHLLLVYEILIKRQLFIFRAMFAVDNDQDVNNG